MGPIYRSTVKYWTISISVATLLRNVRLLTLMSLPYPAVVYAQVGRNFRPLTLMSPPVPSGSLRSGQEKLPPGSLCSGQEKLPPGSLCSGQEKLPSGSLCSGQEKIPSLNLNVPAVPSCSLCSGQEKLSPLKPVLNWENCLFAEHTSDSSTNYNSFLN